MPTVIEGEFTLLSPGHTHKLSSGFDDSEPAVGVSVSLRIEQQSVVPNVATGAPPGLTSREGLHKQVSFIIIKTKQLKKKAKTL